MMKPSISMMAIGMMALCTAMLACMKQVDTHDNEQRVSLQAQMLAQAPVLPGWNLIFEENFDGTEVDTDNWVMYDSPGHNGNGLRKPSAFTVADGILTVTAQMVDGTLVSGGMGHWPGIKYGRFEARVRTEDDPDLVTSGVILTWPDSDNWPNDGENDFYETTVNRRQVFHSYIHHANGPAWHKLHEFDAKEWRVVAMEWDSTFIKIYVDDELQWTITDTSVIPHVPHHICIQLDAFGTSISNPTRMYVDWVRIYERSPCPPTLTTPFVQVNDGSWQQTDKVIVSPSDEVKFGPVPISGGSWSWQGCGTSGTDREQTIYPIATCTATATYWNDCGTPYHQPYTVHVTHALDWGFESGAFGAWQGYGYHAIINDPGNAHTGNYCGRIYSTSGSSGITQTITGLQPSTNYVLRAQVKVSSGGGAVFLGVQDFGSGTVSTSTSNHVYQELAVPFTTGSTSTTAQVYLWKGTPGYAYIDDVILERN